ncbi:MAG: 30S ribosome-binding factor RbfA [Candidatus Cloacimonetes bacterium]|nr:30S ribosome-binding factor RbfA [Candidatus Cloacimonadota bacterium]
MPRIRIQRMESELERLFNLALQHDVRDSRLSWVSITQIRLSPDMKFARVFFTFYADESTDAVQVAELLTRATGFFKGRIAAAHLMRSIPDIRFVYDESEQNARRIDAIFDKLTAQRMFEEGE